jgi:hypothetical protein
LAIHEDSLIVVVNRHGQLLLGLLLPDYVLVEEHFYFLRLGQLIRRAGLRSRRAVVFENGIANRDALIANVGTRIIAGRRDQLGYGILRFMAERTAQDLVGA